MASYKDIFPDKWLKAEHLQGRSVVVTIAGVGIEMVFNPEVRKEERRLIMEFHNKKLRLLLNKSHCVAMTTLTKTEDYTKWTGWQITLSPAVASNRKPTIAISGAPVKAPEPEQAPAGDTTTPDDDAAGETK